MTTPSDITHSLMGTQQYLANKPPITTATRGVTIMSTGVRFDISEPASIPTIEASVQADVEVEGSDNLKDASQ